MDKQNDFSDHKKDAQLLNAIFENAIDGIITINKKGGRDHWARLGTLAFAGGGLNMGQVIGQSTKDASEPATEPITPQMMFGTILDSLFDLLARQLLFLTAP